MLHYRGTDTWLMELLFIEISSFGMAVFYKVNSSHSVFQQKLLKQTASVYMKSDHTMRMRIFQDKLRSCIWNMFGCTPSLYGRISLILKCFREFLDCSKTYIKTAAEFKLRTKPSHTSKVVGHPGKYLQEWPPTSAAFILKMG